MDFARQQRDPTRHLVGITIVVLIHALVIYALVTGLARKAIEVIKKPLNATIIEEIKAPPPPPPPPPPPKKIVEQPKVPPPPEQPYIPPPDIPAPVTQEAPVISSVTTTPPVEPPVIAPPATAGAPRQASATQRHFAALGRLSDISTRGHSRRDAGRNRRGPPSGR